MTDSAPDTHGPQDHERATVTAARCFHRWVIGGIDPTTGVSEIKCERCGEPQPAEGVEGNLWTPPAP